MHAIVRNETHRLRRGKQRLHIPLDEAYSMGAQDPSPLLRLDVECALRQLPSDQARAVGLFYLSGWPIAEIARHLARPEGTIKRWLHQGRQRLATEMKGYYPMEKTWKACIVAPEITPAQLQCVTSGLKAAGWADVQTVTDVRSLNDLYHIENRFIQQVHDGSRTDLPTLTDPPRLVEPLARCDFLILGETIAGRSVFEFLPIVRAIQANLPVCVLESRPLVGNDDSTIYAGWLSGVSLLLFVDLDAAIFAHWFAKMRD